MNTIFSLPMDIYKNRRLVAKLAKNDFKTKYAGSYLGIVWAFIQPVITILVYWFVFSVGFRSGTGDLGVPFVLYLVAGIVPWFFFQDALIGGTNSLLEYNYLVKKVVFKVEILPVIKLISCLFVHVFFVLIMFFVFLISGKKPELSWIQIIYYSFATSMYALALTYLTSAIQVFFKDMAQIVSICLQFGMWLTPIMYDEAIFTSRASWLEWVFKLNPFYYIAAGYRDSMLTGSWFFERPTMTIYFWVVTFILMIIGLKVFKKLRPHFSDVL